MVGLSSLDKLALSIPEAAETISVSRATLYRLIADKVIPVVKIGHRSVVRAIDLERYLEANLGT